jgi:drug/metabolite transporter (DMT)-like permease
VPSHLLFPLFSSIVFVVGMLFAKKAISHGARPWTGTFLGNFWLALAWISVGAFRREFLPVMFWWQAALVGLTFVLGQLFTYLAFQFGDVSVATPIFGVKVIIVALMVAGMTQDPIGISVWIGAILATLGVAFVQAGNRPSKSDSRRTVNHAALTIIMSLGAAISLSLFDVGLQVWGRKHGAMLFLPAMFAATGLLSCLFLPWVDRPAAMSRMGFRTPMLIGTLLMALQAISMSYSLSAFGDAARINIVYALRGLWAVALSWLLARSFGGNEAHLGPGVMLLRLVGAVILTTAVVFALMRPF